MKVGKARIAVIIGKNGGTKKKLEDSLGVKIEIDSKTGDVEVVPDLKNPNYDPLNILTAKKIITAINRGFSPERAMRLLNENYEFDLINLQNILGRSEKRLKRIKGRIIGRNGEMRRAIERFTESYISVYGKTVSIIADYDNLLTARKAIMMLINGLPHHVVYKFLEDKYNEKKKELFRQMYKPEF
ncbi:MAG: KH domain-containing protein [Promethearchaeota archaeon]